MRITKKVFIGLSLGLVLYASEYALAAVVTLPTGLAPGTPYRLVFVTADLAQSSSNNIDDYNSFVTTQASGSTSLAALGTTWSVIGSTPSIDARTNTNTDFNLGTGLPIYNLAGQLVASNNADLWDATLTNPINIDQNGNTVSQKVFTGTATDGTGIADRQLGGPNGFRVQYGEAGQINTSWTTIDWAGTLTGLHFYGISGVLGQSVVPIPAAAWLFGSGLLGLIGMARRKKVA